MRVLVVGASGVIGAHLVPQLRQRGHLVIGTCRSAGKAGRLRELGAALVVLDALDAGRDAHDGFGCSARCGYLPGHGAGRGK